MEHTRVCYFQCARVNGTTFVIHENDSFEEHPFIYVKLYENRSLIVLSDTGCGGGAIDYPHSSGLRDFLETCPIASNQGQPLNPRNANGEASKRYMIICTHCHYDHILGLKHLQAESPRIVASLEGKSFVEDDLPERSLCKNLGIPVPQYTVTDWLKDTEMLCFEGTSLNLQIIHTPGHTPDELAWYDGSERHLFVGDSFYHRVAKDKSYEQAILFPKEGNIIDYLSSLKKLLVFVEAKNKDESVHQGPLKISCGHVTTSVDAMGILVDVQELFARILQGKVPTAHSEEKRGEEYVTWRDDVEPKFAVTAPRRIIDEARQTLGG